MEKLSYRCKDCGWEKSIPAQWADVSPRYCGNKKCKYSGRVKQGRTSFLKEPKMLEIIMPTKAEPKVHVPVSKAPKKQSSEVGEKIAEKRTKRKKNRG